MTLMPINFCFHTVIIPAILRRFSTSSIVISEKKDHGNGRSILQLSKGEDAACSTKRRWYEAPVVFTVVPLDAVRRTVRRS